MNRIGVIFWNIKAPFYHSIRSLPFFNKILKQEISSLKALMENASLHPMKILDVGTGVGSTLDIFPDSAHIIGVDYVHNMVLKLKDKKKVTGVVGNAIHLPFKNNSVPFISAIGITEYLSNKIFFLDEIKKIISSDGYFLVTITLPGFYNFLRHLIGHRIHPVQSDTWETMVAERGFSCVGKMQTWLQNQYLFVIKNTSFS